LPLRKPRVSTAARKSDYLEANADRGPQGDQVSLSDRHLPAESTDCAQKHRGLTLVRRGRARNHASDRDTAARSRLPLDQLLAYDFDTFVGGHLTSIGTRRDVEIAKECTLDVYHTVKRIHNTMDHPVVVANAVKKIGTDDNEFLLFKVLFDKVT
jgi:hypothetical protein